MSEKSDISPEDISKKRKILLAASKLFMEKDFKTVSTQEIATTAGVAKGTVFHHYANKHLLALAVMDEFIKQMGDEFREMAAEMKPEEVIVAMIRYGIDMVENAMGLNQLLIQVIADLDYLSKEPQNDVEWEIQEKVKIIETLLIGYIEEIAVIFDKMGFEHPTAYSRIFVGMLDGLGLQLLLNPKPDRILMEQLTQTMITIFTKR